MSESIRKAVATIDITLEIPSTDVADYMSEWPSDILPKLQEMATVIKATVNLPPEMPRTVELAHY